MAYTRRDTEGAFLGGNPLPSSEATPQPSPEREHANPPPHCMQAAAPSVRCSSYDPQWNAPTLHSSVQDQRYDVPVPSVNGMAHSYGAWADAQQSAPFTPAAGTSTNAVMPYMNRNQNYDAANAANGPTAYYQDDRIAVSNRDLHGHFTTGAQPGGVVDYGPTLADGHGASAHSAAGNVAIQTFAPDGEAPAPSESLRTLSRRYVLDPGTRFETVNIGPNRCGRLKIIIALEVADGV